MNIYIIGTHDGWVYLPVVAVVADQRPVISEQGVVALESTFYPYGILSSSMGARRRAPRCSTQPAHLTKKEESYP